MRPKFFYLFILVSLISCEKNTPNNEVKFDRDKAKAEIKSAYMDWATASKNKNSATMYRLSYPDENFEGMTKVCVEDWNDNFTLYYLFSSLNVTHVDEVEASIEGISDMIQGPNGEGINFREKFLSSAVFSNGKWLLDGMNTYELIESY
jgi:hypothetical protein